MLEKADNYLYIYVVDRDFGFAPNPFHGYCTLATCKPKIRNGASIGNWIMGIGGGSIKSFRQVYFHDENNRNNDL